MDRRYGRRLLLRPRPPARPVRRRRIMLALGVAMTVAFFVIRAVNRYGDPVPLVRTPRRPLFPELHEIPAIPGFPAHDAWPRTAGACVARPPFAQARQPAHRFRTDPAVLLRRALLCRPYCREGTGAAPLRTTGALVPLSFPSRRWADPRTALPPDFGYDLWVVYVVWFAIVIAMYPLCRWYASVKARRREWWWSYL